MTESYDQTNRPMTPEPSAETLEIDGLCLQGGVIAAAAAQYERMKKVFAAANALDPAGPERHVPQTFNDFLDARIVEGLIHQAPTLTECQRLAGLAEPMPDGAHLLLVTLAEQMRQLSDGLAVLLAQAHPGGFERLAVHSLQDTATMLAACAAGLKERETGR